MKVCMPLFSDSFITSFFLYEKRCKTCESHGYHQNNCEEGQHHLRVFHVFPMFPSLRHKVDIH